MTADLTFIRVTWDPGSNWRSKNGKKVPFISSGLHRPWYSASNY